jgi:hypothetical protein
MASNGRIINEMDIMLKEAVLVLSQHLPGGTEENHSQDSRCALRDSSGVQIPSFFSMFVVTQRNDI